MPLPFNEFQTLKKYDSLVCGYPKYIYHDREIRPINALLKEYTRKTKKIFNKIAIAEKLPNQLIRVL